MLTDYSSVITDNYVFSQSISCDHNMMIRIMGVRDHCNILFSVTLQKGLTCPEEYVDSVCLYILTLQMTYSQVFGTSRQFVACNIFTVYIRIN